MVGNAVAILVSNTELRVGTMCISLTPSLHFARSLIHMHMRMPKYTCIH